MIRRTTTARSAFSPILRLAAAALLAGTTLATMPAGARAETDASAVDKIRPTAADSYSARKVDVVIGKSLMIELPRDAKEVFVASPEYANAVVRTPRKIFIIGLKAGSTSVLINDAEGRQIMALDIGIAKEMTRELNVLRDVLKQALPTSNINAKGVGNNIVLSGVVDSMLDAQRAIDISKNLVGKSASIFSGEAGGEVVNALTVRGKDQVMLKVTVSEINRSIAKQLGVNFSGSWKVGGTALNAVLDNPFTIQSTLTNTAIGGGTNVPTIKTLERNGLMRTLAEPTLTAVSGEAAKFLAGGEVPVPSNEACDQITRACTVSINYKPIGVSLTFTPLVMSENRISIRVGTEVTEIDADNQITLKSVSVPGFRTRRMETTVELPSGGVMATAGLLMQHTRQGVNGLPALLNLPVLGALFRSRDYQRNESELLIMVQPFIVKPTDPGQIARPDDGYADASDPSAAFMNRMVRSYGQGVVRPNPYGNSRVGFIND